MSVEFLGIIILSVVLAVVLSAYERLQRKVKGIRIKQEEIEAKAQQRAAEVIKEAGDKALAIIGQAKLEAANEQQEFSNKLAQVEAGQVEVYKTMLQNISNKIEIQAESEISDFKSAVEKETLKEQQLMEKSRQEKYQSIEAELEEYRKAKIQSLDNKAEELVRDFLRTLTGKVFNIGDQRELINNALEEAKKNNVF